MKKQLIYFFTVLCILFSFSSCEKDLQEEVNNNSNSTNNLPFSTRVVSFKDIPGIADYTNKKLRGMSSKSTRDADDGMLIDESSVIENIDTLGNKNYSIHFVYEDTPENVFYNLVINEPVSGEKKAYLLKYICNPEDFNTFKSHNFDFHYFVGVTELSSIEAGTGKKLSARKDNDDECPKVLIPSPHTTTGTSWGTSGGGSESGGTGNSGFNTTVIGYNASAGSSGGISSVTIGGITYYAGGGSSGGNSGGGIDIPGCNCYNGGGWVSIRIKQLPYSNVSKGASRNGNCREETVPEGYVPVNTQSQLLWLRTLVGGLSKPQFFYLNSHPETVEAILKYVNSNMVNGVVNAEATNFAKELIDLASTETNHEDVNSLLNMSIQIDKNSDRIFEDDFITSLDPYMDVDLTNPPPDFSSGLFGIKFFIKYRKLRELNPEWSRAKCLWHASKAVIHLGLDAFGLIPVVGEVADLTNGALYTIEGDGLNATLSYASAVPVAGWAAFGVKYAVKVKTAYSTSNKIKLVWKVLPDKTIYFGSNNTCRRQLRKALNMVVGNLNQAHHIIPLNLQRNEIVQKAFKSDEAFHLNEALNGIPLSTAVHSGSHPHYDNLILDYLNVLPANATPNQCYNKVQEIIAKIRTAIANNPNTPINQLNF